MVDEMDLLIGMKDAEPLRPRTFDEARAVLRAAMAVEAAPETKTASRRRARWGMPRAGFRVALAAAAAAAAVTLVVTSTSAPRPASSVASAASSTLMTLAADITADSGPLPGNASLIIRTQKESGHPTEVSYNLYTDSGAFYGGADKKSLMQAVKDNQNEANGTLANEVKAALSAASGNLSSARVEMANAAGNFAWLSLSPAAQQKFWQRSQASVRQLLIEKGDKNPPKPQPLPTGKALYKYMDSSVWWYGVDALSAGSGNPQVRAGVLRLLSTVSGVTVAHSTTGGQPTLTITTGADLGGNVLTVNARTGMPISWRVPGAGKVPSSVDTFQVQRLTLGNVEAGKF